MFSVEEVLDMAVRLERNGEAVYRQAAARMPDPRLKDLLAWMADEESRHAEWFSRLKSARKITTDNPLARDMGREILNQMIGDQSFSLTDTDFSSMTEVDDLIRVFIEFERDTIIFYEMLRPFIDAADTLAQLNRIVAEENRHIERLTEYLREPEPMAS